MIKMKAPEVNRHGRYEIHDVPSRKVDLYRAWGWKEVGPEPTPEPAGNDEVWDFGEGQWFTLRKKVQSALGLDAPPKSKKEAMDLLEEAGYKVEE